MRSNRVWATIVSLVPLAVWQKLNIAVFKRVDGSHIQEDAVCMYQSIAKCVQLNGFKIRSRQNRCFDSYGNDLQGYRNFCLSKLASFLVNNFLHKQSDTLKHQTVTSQNRTTCVLEWAAPASSRALGV